MPTGVLKWFDHKKGYGFITPDEDGPDVFVHIRTVQASGLIALEPYQSLEYEFKTNRKGPVATTVKHVGNS